MRKLIVSLIILVALVLLGGPYLIGLQAEGNVRGFFAKYADAQDKVELKLNKFTRGWFSSEVEFKVSFHDTNSIVPAINQIFTSKLQHGPIIWHGKQPGVALLLAPFNFLSDPQIKSELDKWFAKQEHSPKLVGNFVFGLLGNYKFELNAPVFTFADPK